MGEYSTSRYNEIIKFLGDDAKVRGRLLDFLQITGGVNDLFESSISEECSIRVSLQIIADLWEIGIEPVDLLEGDDPPFLRWAMSKEDALAKIEDGMRNAGEDMDYIDICFFAYVREGTED